MHVLKAVGVVFDVNWTFDRMYYTHGAFQVMKMFTRWVSGNLTNRSPSFVEVKVDYEQMTKFEVGQTRTTKCYKYGNSVWPHRYITAYATPKEKAVCIEFLKQMTPVTDVEAERRISLLEILEK